MFVFIIQVILTFVISYISYRYWILFQIRRKLNWIPHAPRVPFLGSALEFGRNTTELLENVLRLSNNPEKTFYYEMGIQQHGILVKNHELMEFLLSLNKMEIINKSKDYEIFEPWLGTGLLTAKGMKWKQRRRIITPAFHFSILEQFIDVFETNGNILLKKLKDEVGKDSVNIYKYLTSYTLDVISESAMGVSIKSLEGNNQDYVAAVRDMCRINITRAFSPLPRNDFIFRLTPDYKAAQSDLKIMHGFTNSIIAKRIKELKNKDGLKLSDNSEFKKKRLAFLDLLLSSAVDGKPLSNEDIREEVDTFMFEGHDTTSFAVSMTLYLLANHQEIQTLARNEQKEIFGNNKDRPSSFHDLNEMAYLDLVIKESLRLYPSVPMIGRNADEDIEFKGNIIPKGTQLLMFIYGINRDPDYHEKANEFIVDRHLTTNSKYFSNIPFSAGPRNCIGQRFAILEMKSIISKILRNFELLPTNPVHIPTLAMEAVFKPLDGVNIRIKNHAWK